MKGDRKDVSFFEDALFGIQHAVSAEHHAKESYSMTKEKIWADINKIIRPMRSKYLYRITKEANAQGYCISKHLAGFAQSLKEMGDRYTEDGEEELSKECFNDSQTVEKIIMIINDIDKSKGGKN